MLYMSMVALYWILKGEVVILYKSVLVQDHLAPFHEGVIHFLPSTSARAQSRVLETVGHVHKLRRNSVVVLVRTSPLTVGCGSLAVVCLNVGRILDGGTA